MFEYILNACHMGGYGIYIWPCYLLFLGLLAWQIFASLRRNALLQNKIRRDLWNNRDKQA